VSDAPTIPAAKPYAGSAQFRALAIARKAFIDAGILERSQSYAYRPTVEVSGRGSVILDGQVFRVATMDIRLGHSVAARPQAEQLAAIEQFLAALRAAGWTLEERGRLSANRSFVVYGPGLDEYAATARQKAAAAAAREQELWRQREAESAALKAFLEAHGITKYLSPIDTRVTLSLTDLRTIIDAARATEVTP